MTGRSGVWLLLALFAVGCGRGGNRFLETSLPPDVRADYEVFVSNCGKCHSLARPLNAPIQDVKHWDLYVAKMVRTPGSGISDREVPAILRFLYFYTRQKHGRNEERDESELDPELEPASETSASAEEEQP